MDQYIVTGMTCAACQAHVEKAVAKLPEVSSVSVSLLTNSMAVEGNAKPEDVIRAVEGAGYGAQLRGVGEKRGASASDKLAAEEDALKDRETPKLKKRLLQSVIWLVVLMYITMGHNMWGWPVPGFLVHNHIGLAVVQMLIAIVVMYINKAFFVSGFRGLARLSPNMDALVALGSSVSFGWSVYVLMEMTCMVTGGAANEALMDLYHNQLYFETAAMIPALITVGKTLEALSKGRTTDALKNLIKMAPKTAVIERDGEETEVPVGEVQPGDILIVKPGASIPVDGVIIEGNAAVDESALTGESIPVDKTEGDTVSAATINLSGFIRARAVRVGEDTAFSRIIQMVSDAAATKAPIARIADRVSAVFVPAVIGIAAIVLAAWLIAGRGAVFALERAISVLVISCPCALGLATPVAVMVGNGIGARNGILFKNSEALENAGRIQIAALDKTGTVTEGRPEVTDILPAPGTSEEELMICACSLEKRSEHPLAKAVVSFGEAKGVRVSEITGFTALAGSGVEGRMGGKLLRGGSVRFISSAAQVSREMLEKAESLAEEGKTPLLFEREGTLLGIIAAADVIKEDSAQAVRELKNMGIETVMLTGDNGRTAKAIGVQAGVDRVIAGVLPDGKEAVIRELQSRGKTSMVGDGINDAPALTRADTGIAIGAGTDIAIDSADIVLMNSKLTDVSAAIRLSRATLRNIHENLFWAFAYNAILIPMAAGLYPGIQMNPMWGAAAMSLSSFTVCMNALRLNLFKVHDASRDRPLRRKARAGNGAEAFVTDMSIRDQEKKDENGPAPAGADHGYIGPAGTKGGIVMTKTVKIEGMMCAHCEAAVKKALEALEGVESAEVSHVKGTAVLTLSGPVVDEAVKAAVEAKDYTFIGIE